MDQQVKNNGPDMEMRNIMTGQGLITFSTGHGSINFQVV